MLFTQHVHPPKCDAVCVLEAWGHLRRHGDVLASVAVVAALVAVIGVVVVALAAVANWIRRESTAQ